MELILVVGGAGPAAGPDAGSATGSPRPDPGSARRLAGSIVAAAAPEAAGAAWLADLAELEDRLRRGAAPGDVEADTTAALDAALRRAVEGAPPGARGALAVTSVTVRRWLEHVAAPVVVVAAAAPEHVADDTGTGVAEGASTDAAGALAAWLGLHDLVPPSARAPVVVPDELVRADVDAAGAQLWARLSGGGPDPATRAERVRGDREREVHLLRAIADAAAEERDEALAAADDARRALERVTGRQGVRLALRAARVLRPLVRQAHALRRRVSRTRVGAPEPPPAHEPATLAESETVAQRLLRTAPGSERAAGPLVSIVVLNRDGAHHLRRLLPALVRTHYRSFELIVVDNGSSDESVTLVEGAADELDVTIVRNRTNRSFSEGNNQGLARARGEHVLLLNNDVEPFVPGWLGRLVDTLERTEAVAVGARLVYPRRPDLRDNAGDTLHPDLTLQHRGVHLVPGPDGFPQGRNLGEGEDPFGPEAAAVRDIPAVTAACLLVRRDALDAVGGLTLGYRYGTEDVDLCLKLRAAGGRIVYDGGAVLWHHEYGTQNVAGRERKRRNRVHNRTLFVQEWGPRLVRTVLRDRVTGTGDYSLEAAAVAVVGRGPSVGVLRAASGRAGWRAVDAGRGGAADPPADIVLVADAGVDVRTLHRGSLTVAVVGIDPAPWAATGHTLDHDVVVAYDERGAEAVREATGRAVRIVGSPVGDGREAAFASALRAAVLDWIDARRLAIAIGVPDRSQLEEWGDTHFARDLRRSLERRGLPTRIEILPDWGAPTSAWSDGVVHLFGRSRLEPRPSQVTILWVISHPDLVAIEDLDRYDQVLVASDAFARTLAARTTVPVEALHQATAPERFRPGPPRGPVADGAGTEHSVLFVGNSRGSRRRILDDLLAKGAPPFELAVYGAGWTPELLDPRYVRGTHVPNADLASYYARAAVVLNDHWDDMRAWGFLSNRLYDALAAGAFVVSDHVDGIDEEFDGAVATYRTAAELRALIADRLARPDERARAAARGRRAVLDRHTFDHRAAVVAAHCTRLLAGHAGAVVAHEGHPAGTDDRRDGSATVP